MKPAEHRRIVIVDGYLTGAELVRELLERNVECLHLRSVQQPPAALARDFNQAIYDADLGYVGEPAAAIRFLSDFGPDAVVAGSATGVTFAETVALGMKLPANRPELAEARRGSAHIGRVALDPCFTLSAVGHRGRRYITDAWRVRRSPGAHVDALELLDPALPGTVALIEAAGDAMDSLGMTNGAAHAVLAPTPDGPIVVQAAACLATAPMDRAAYAAAGLVTQAGAFAALLSGTNAARAALLKARHYRLARHMTKLLFTFDAAAVVISLMGLSRLRALASFHGLHKPLAKGDRVRPTTALIADGGVVYLIHDDPDQIAADMRQFRLWESRGELYGLAPLVGER